MTTSSNPHRTTDVLGPRCSLLAVIALLLITGACADGKNVSTRPAATAAASSTAPTTRTTSTAPATSATSPTTTPLSSEPVLGVPGEPPVADPDGSVMVPSSPGLVRYEKTVDVRDQQVVTMTAGRVEQGKPFFSPTILLGSSNQRVTLRISNTTPTTHNFTLEAEHVSTSLPVGATVDITVQFPSSGALVFYCRFHAEELHGGGLYTID